MTPLLHGSACFALGVLCTVIAWCIAQIVRGYQREKRRQHLLDCEACGAAAREAKRANDVLRRNLKEIH